MSIWHTPPILVFEVIFTVPKFIPKGQVLNSHSSLIDLFNYQSNKQLIQRMQCYVTMVLFLLLFNLSANLSHNKILMDQHVIIGVSIFIVRPAIYIKNNVISKYPDNADKLQHGKVLKGNISKGTGLRVLAVSRTGRRSFQPSRRTNLLSPLLLNWI